MGNFQPDFRPYCGSELAAVEPPTYHECGTCERDVFYDPTPGRSVAVVDGDRLLLVEDCRSPGEWKLPSAAVEAGESLREGAARELEEETNLAVDPAALAFVRDGASESVAGEHMTNVAFAVDRSATTGRLESGSSPTDPSASLRPRVDGLRPRVGSERDPLRDRRRPRVSVDISRRRGRSGP